MGIGNNMAAKRIVSEAQAEINTFKHSQFMADISPAGAKKVAAKERSDDFKRRINKKAGKRRNQR